VSCETSFDSKQSKLEPKLVSILSKTRCLYRLFRFYIETASFGVSVETKTTETNQKNCNKVKVFKISKTNFWQNLRYARLTSTKAQILDTFLSKNNGGFSEAIFERNKSFAQKG
jgi:hypothetical protein